MLKKILQREASVLREISEEVKVEEIKGAKIQKILSEMKSALDSQDDGVAIAAPQIGYNLRIFIASRKIKDIVSGKKEAQDSEDINTTESTAKDIVFINPVIKKISKEKRSVEEGCLSVRYLYGKVQRSHKATVQAYDENGKKFTMGGVGLLAQVFQHEIEHLDGILFIDKARDLEEIPPEDLKTKKRNATKRI